MSEDIKLKISADSSDAVKDLGKVEKAIDDTTKSVKENTKAVKDNKTESKSMLQSLADVKAGYDGIKEVLTKVIEYLGESIKKYRESGADLKELGKVMQQTTKDANDLQLATGKLFTSLANTVLADPKAGEKSTLGTVVSLLNKISDWVNKNSDTIGTVLTVAALANPITGPVIASVTVLGKVATELDEITEAAKRTKKEMSEMYKYGIDPSKSTSGLRRTVTDLPALKTGPKTKGKSKAKLSDAQFIDSLGPARGSEARSMADELAQQFDERDAEMAQAKIDRQKMLDDMVQRSIEENVRRRDDAHQKEMQQIAERNAALQASVGAYNTVANAAVSALQTAGVGERELAFLQGLIAQANAIGAFFNPALGGPAGAAAFQAQAVALFAAAGKSGGSGGGGGGKGGSSAADLQSQRLQAQKENTMALKEAFSEALKEANNQGRNITYVINQNGTYLGNDNTSLVRIKEALDGTQRLQFR